jgi:DNA-binding MarR family transcriptional regulator
VKYQRSGASADGDDGYQELFTIQNEIQMLFVHALEIMLAKEGITVPQAMTLKALSEHDQMCKMSDLAAMRFLTPAAATGIVDRLIHLGLVERKFDDSDRRVILLALTTQGVTTASVIEDRVRETMKRFYHGISRSDRAASLRIFRKLKEYLKEELNAHKRK